VADTYIQSRAEEATRLLPHLALGLYRAIKMQQPTEHILKAIQNCGSYLDAAERHAARR
jgi:hypothetical protein